MLLANNITKALLENDELPEYFLRKDGELYIKSDAIIIKFESKNKLTKSRDIIITTLYKGTPISETIFKGFYLCNDLKLNGFEAISKVEVLSI